MPAVLSTLAEAKAVIGLTNNQADARIQLCLDAAESWVARLLDTAFKTTARTEYFDGGGGSFYLGGGPVVSVSEIYDSSRSSIFDATQYALIGNEVFGVDRVSNPWAAAWEGGRRRWKATYVYGYNNGDTGTPPVGSEPAPEGIKQAVLALCKRSYFIGEGVTQDGSIKVSYDSLCDGEIMEMLQPYRFAGGVV